MKTTKGSYNKKSPFLIDRLLPFGTKRRLFTKLAFLVITKPGPLFRNLNGTNIKGFFYHLCTSNAAAVDWIITSKLQPSTPLDYKQSSVQSNKDQGIICYHPFTSLSFFFTGETYSCMCSVWPKYSIGNIKLKTIAEMWNSKTSQWIRRKMYEGKWQDICKPTCPVIIDYLRSKRFIKYEDLEKHKELTPKLINEIRAGKDYLESPPVFFQPDTSSACNLRCIMCSGKETADDPDMQKKLWADLKHYLPAAKEIFLTGWGEPLVRPDTRDLLINYKGSAKFGIITNGLLLPKYWKQIKYQQFAWLNISVDAATKETYEKIRVGGKWEDLLKALDLVKQNRNKFEKIMLKRIQKCLYETEKSSTLSRNT